ncbi:MAG TPA: hypothetical protein VKU62_01060 [Thermoanaerobaculia bacterium]|nr:hypothetical protein [Thermoanaerobaculia bacterium]
MKSLILSVFVFCVAAVCAAQVRTNGVVQPLPSAPQLLIPAAGTLAGANGTFFRSDIAIANFADHDQLVKLQWLPEGASSTVTKTIALTRLNFVHFGDFVADVLGQTGLGAILVTGVTSSGDPDPNAALYVQSQIWTPAFGGTTSQSFPAIPTASINTSSAGLFFPRPQRDGSFRANVGVVNLDPVNAQTIQIAIPSPLPVLNVTLVVPPMGMQVAPLGDASPFAELNIANATPASTKSNSWVAWGSTIDNVTGDAWSELAVANAPQLIFPTPIGK